MPTVGYIVGMPGSVVEGGQSKVPGGYSENIYSLDRWTWIDRARESVIASPFGRDFSTPIGGRYFPFPLSAPYHPLEPDPDRHGSWRPVSGYDSAATLSGRDGSLEAHVPEIEWALSSMYGTGAATQLRGRKLWDGPQSKAAIMKWIAWAKRYRRVLSAEFVTIANGTSCWGRGEPLPNSTCTHAGLDAVLHRAPRQYYSDIAERALAMVWNPTPTNITTTLLAPLYYAGLSSARGVRSLRLAQEGRTAISVPLGANDTVALHVSLPPRGLTWFVFTEDDNGELVVDDAA